MTHIRSIAGLFYITLFCVVTNAQAPKPAEPSKALQASTITPGDPNSQSNGPAITRAFTLKNITEAQEGNEIVTALRNTLDPHDRVTYIWSQNTILINAPEEHLAFAEKVINTLDKPKKAYRLVYTLIDLDNGKRVGDEHYNMVVVSGQHAVLKQGNKVPVVMGIDPKNSSSQQSQISYVDVGITIDATVDDSTTVLRLKTRVEQSGVAEDRLGGAAQDPVLRQTVFEGAANLGAGRPLTIGLMDVAGTTRRMEIQVTIDPVAP